MVRPTRVGVVPAKSMLLWLVDAVLSGIVVGWGALSINWIEESPGHFRIFLFQGGLVLVPDAVEFAGSACGLPLTYA